LELKHARRRPCFVQPTKFGERGSQLQHSHNRRDFRFACQRRDNRWSRRDALRIGNDISPSTEIDP
jgi:hypothetical protein